MLSTQVHSLYGVIVDKRDLANLPCFCRCEALREPLRGRVVLVVCWMKGFTNVQARAYDGK
jgi:hypothetical protein